MRKSKTKIRFVAVVLVFILLTVVTSTHHLYKYLKSLTAEVDQMKQLLSARENEMMQPQHVVKRRSLTSLNTEDDGQQPTSPNTRIGVTYVRWGRRDCPYKIGSQLVYQGYVGGSLASYVGGGSDFLCLHSNVTYTQGHYVDGVQGPAYVHGAEYRDTSDSYSLFNLSLIEDRTLLAQGVPCAVCLTPSSTQLMIPSRETCPKGWRVEYTGYIMTGGYLDTKHSSKHICVDDTPQAIPGTQGNQNAAYLYAAQINCATNIPCGPYVSGREIRCVVCSYNFKG